MSPSITTSLDARLYRAALWLCPASFRDEYADEMLADFREAHGEASMQGDRAVWKLRLLMALDLARTFGVQWARTGWPVIALLSVIVGLGLAEGAATLARHARFELPTDPAYAETIGVLLLATISVFVIAIVIVIVPWVMRPIRRGRRERPCYRRVV